MFSKYRVSFSADIQKTLTQFPHLGTRRGKPKRGLSFCGGRAGGAARRPLPPLQELLKSCPQQGSPPGSCHSTCPLCQHRGQIYLDLTVLDSTVVGAQRFTQQSARVGLGCSPAEALRCGCLRSFCSLTSAQAAQLLPMHPSHALLLCRVAICTFAGTLCRTEALMARLGQCLWSAGCRSTQMWMLEGALLPVLGSSCPTSSGLCGPLAGAARHGCVCSSASNGLQMANHSSCLESAVHPLLQGLAAAHCSCTAGCGSTGLRPRRASRVHLGSNL